MKCNHSKKRKTKERDSLKSVSIQSIDYIGNFLKPREVLDFSLSSKGIHSSLQTHLINERITGKKRKSKTHIEDLRFFNEYNNELLNNTKHRKIYNTNKHTYSEKIIPQEEKEHGNTPKSNKVDILRCNRCDFLFCFYENQDYHNGIKFGSFNYCSNCYGQMNNTFS